MKILFKNKIELKNFLNLPNDLVTSSESELVAMAPMSTINTIFFEITDEAYKNLIIKFDLNEITFDFFFRSFLL